jgi:hypothetical protein
MEIIDNPTLLEDISEKLIPYLESCSNEDFNFNCIRLRWGTTVQMKYFHSRESCYPTLRVIRSVINSAPKIFPHCGKVFAFAEKTKKFDLYFLCCSSVVKNITL